MFKRKLFCANCEKEVADGEKIYAEMEVPKQIMVEIKSYLKKKSTIFCSDCIKRVIDK